MSDEELMPLSEIDALNPTYTHAWLAQTARAAHALKVRCEELEGAQVLRERIRHCCQKLIKLVGADGPMDFENVIDKVAIRVQDLEEENAKLRAVYETARRVLRYEVVDFAAWREASRHLDDACEAVKQMNAWNGDETPNNVEQKIKEARAKERERCAKVVERFRTLNENLLTVENIVKTIRALKDEE